MSTHLITSGKKKAAKSPHICTGFRPERGFYADAYYHKGQIITWGEGGTIAAALRRLHADLAYHHKTLLATRDSHGLEPQEYNRRLITTSKLIDEAVAMLLQITSGRGL